MSFKYPLVTIITVTYNCQNLVESTIKSVCSQIYPNIEYFIIDGGSKDGTVELIKKHTSCITQFISEKDNGIYDAMNKGIHFSSQESKYITFLNAGDVYADEFSIRDIIVSAKSTESNLYGDILVNQEVVASPDILNQFVLATNMVCHQACFFQTETHRNHLYDTRYEISADYKLLLDLIVSGEPFEKINLIVGEMDPTGVSHTKRALLMNEKRRIRKLYPSVYMYAGLKKLFRRVSSIGLVWQRWHDRN